MADYLTHLDTIWGLLALGLLAFGDTVIGVGFFVFGEIAFLAAGAGFAANGSVYPVLIVLIAAWLGDLTSFYLGKRFGSRVLLRFLNRRKRRLAWRHARRALNKRGVTFVILSRLLGPVAWVTPFLAGTLEMSPLKFAAAAAVGVGLGVGQFLVVGALGMQALTLLGPHSSWLLPLLTTAAIGIATAVYLLPRRTYGS